MPVVQNQVSINLSDSLPYWKSKIKAEMWRNNSNKLVMKSLQYDLGAWQIEELQEPHLSWSDNK